MQARGPLVAILLVTTAVVAGCIDETADAPDPAATGSDFSYEDERFTIKSINDSAKQWTPTLDEPPQLSLGEYWKFKVTSGFDGAEYEAYAVVAGQEDDHWLIGMPTHDFSNDILVYHLPGLGQVRKDTLGFEAHDFWLDPIRFPVVEGDSWKSGFMAGPDTLWVNVTAVDGLKATITVEGNRQGVLTYDAGMRGFSKMEWQGYATYEVIEHGFDWHVAVPQYEGTVTVPHMSDLIMCHGRLALVVEITNCGVGAVDAPMETVDVDSTYDRVSFSLITLTIPPAPNTYLELDVNAPDGTSYLQTLTPLDPMWLKMVSYKHDKPGGQWDIRAIAAGAGQAFIEGIGYHVYDVELPSGRILPSIGEHQHGHDEGH